MPQPPQQQITKQFASVLLDTGSVATSLAIGLTAAHATWDTLHWSGDLRIIAAGALVITLGAASESVLSIILAPVRRSLWSSPSSRTAGEPTQAAAETSEEGLAQVTAAAVADAAHRASSASYALDHGAIFTAAERWRGYASGDATFYLSPGTVLHCQFTQERHPRAEFTLLTSEAYDPVEIRTVRDVLQYLTAQARAKNTRATTAEASPARTEVLTDEARLSDH
ncbi:hypothetical protein ACTU45_31600 [Streptomyces sp. 24-1644]|uniref:hypothetical protein n=1 Tax=Streptomyces sp. 24-1644 TaxID=3457315 RepID=UPI003FA7C8AE